MNFNNIHTVYLLGIGGIGMSALARYFNAMGKDVCGYDKTETTLTQELISEGIEIHFEENLNKIKGDKEDTLVIYTPAVPKEHKEYQYFLSNGFTVKKRSEVLGEITRNSFTIAVAGTHGKTTTSSIVAHLLTQSKKGCNAFLGGITQNYNSNLLLNPGSNITVVEADEYDRSFLTLFPDVAIVTSMDADHLDIYGDKKSIEESFILFTKQVKNGGKLIYKKGLPLPDEITSDAYSYSAATGADFYAENIRVEKGKFVFDFKSKIEHVDNVKLITPGRHNVENSVAALAAAQLAGASADELKSAIENFKGVKRRFEFHIGENNLVFIDDYAHHPEELKACISAIKELYPSRKVSGIFQPHLYSRTRDFVDEFASSLDLLDECILLNIYPARELPIKGVTSQIIMDKMRLKNKFLLSKEELLDFVSKSDFQVLLTMGAGDIDMLVEPIKNTLEKRVIKQ